MRGEAKLLSERLRELIYGKTLRSDMVKFMPYRDYSDFCVGGQSGKYRLKRGNQQLVRVQISINAYNSTYQELDSVNYAY